MQSSEAQPPSIKATAQDNRGRSIGNYILGKTIGQGTFGKVKLGTHTLTGQKVAIKVLEKNRIIDVADVERVSREIHILKLIRHPNIIQLYQIVQTPKQLFLVMEYVSDGELFDYIVKKKKIKQQQACEFLHQILAGVEYLHKLNIVHRDLKPENLLIDFNRRIKLVDFGLSNTYKKSNSPCKLDQLLKTACGSPCYAAPEMIAGKKYEGLNVDVWSCGVILFAMVCGYLPFEDPNTSALYKKILAGDYTIPKFVSNQARQLIKGILNTDPEKRMTLKDIKNHRWMAQARLPTQCQGLIVGYHKMPIDVNILEELKQFSFQPETSKRYLESNRHNHMTTTYYLVLKKNLKNNQASPADICNQAFDRKQMEPAPKKKDKVAEVNQDLFGDDMDFDNDAKRRKIMSQLGKRQPPVTEKSQNLPNVKQKFRRTVNRFSRYKKNTVNAKLKQIDVDLYDFESSLSKNLVSVTHNHEDKSKPDTARQPVRDSNLFNRTRILFNPPRYGSISSRDESLDVPERRRISVKQADLNKTFRVTKNTFDIKNAYGSIDVKRHNRRSISNKRADDDDTLRHVINSITLKRAGRNYQHLF